MFRLATLGTPSTEGTESVWLRQHATSSCAIAVVVVCLVAVTGPSRADDWTQWLGNQRDGTWSEAGVLEKFPEGGLKTTWVKPIGSGYSGPVVAGGRIYVTDYRPVPKTTKLEAIERVVCLDEQTGDTIWSQQWETHYRRQLQSYATGPRAAPLVYQGNVYTIGATGMIHCADAKTGEIRWSHDALAVFDAQVPTFGVSASPVPWKELVIFAAGGGDGILRALNKDTGKEVWRALPVRYELPYSAPVLMTLRGKTQLVQWDQQFLSGLDPDTGRVIWQAPFSARSNMAIARPMAAGEDRVLISGFYDGSMLVRVTDDGANVIWKVGGKGEKPEQTRGLHAVMTTPIIEGDFFYGTCSYGELRGLRLDSGERVWENKQYTRQGRWGSFFWVKNGDRYFVNNDLGELLMMKFSPKGPELLGRTRLIEPNTHCGYGPRRFADAMVNWVQPAYANRHVVIRNDSEIRRVSLAAE